MDCCLSISRALNIDLLLHSEVDMQQKGLNTGSKRRGDLIMEGLQPQDVLRSTNHNRWALILILDHSSL